MCLRPSYIHKTTELLTFLQRGSPGNIQERRAYFADFVIAKDEDAVEQHFARHIVLLLDLTNVIGGTISDLRSAFLVEVKRAVMHMKRTGCFANANELDESDASFLRKLMTVSSSTLDASQAETILRNISRIVHELSKRPILFLMDEYDSPIAYSAEHGFHEEDNEHVEGAMIIGILHLCDAGYLSEVDNLSVFTLRDKRYSTSCMFSAAETRVLIEKYKQQSPKAQFPSFEDLSAWYEGYYNANGERLYNPWSVVHALGEKNLEPFWLQSGRDDKGPTRILQLLEESAEFTAMFEALVARDPLRIELDSQFKLDTGIKLMDPLQILTFMYYAGYMTPIPTDSAEPATSNAVAVAIPNYEIWAQFCQWLEAGLTGSLHCWQATIAAFIPYISLPSSPRQLTASEIGPPKRARPSTNIGSWIKAQKSMGKLNVKN
ncbi:hypothetical protein FA95DRAFT_1572105 [Auriscalpium vulgare]|uniref:Uncharacterized protein n=1 Tax=Auriscalpium vulgare TaxID=40419 RepID=A0ACB8RWY1_9AGAM|nr:hypothetical protein FA95DRAFT_1572105 [Auriscalpium vulgare]